MDTSVYKLMSAVYELSLLFDLWGGCYDMSPVGWVSLFRPPNRLILKQALLKVGPMVGSTEMTML